VTRKKNAFWPSGSSLVRGATSETVRGLSCAAATFVNTSCTAWAVEGAAALAARSVGCERDGTKAPARWSEESSSVAASRLGTVRTSSMSPVALWIRAAIGPAVAALPTTATGIPCGSGLWKPPR